MREKFGGLPTEWDGKSSILEMKKVDFQWRQMEWWAFYFEYQCMNLLKENFAFPGHKFGRIVFDMRGSINWDLKSKAIRSDDHRAILNDMNSMDQSISNDTYHGVVLALCDVEYNDADRSFQRWHDTLKGGKSKYVRERESRSTISRYRKTHAKVVEIQFLVFDKDNVKELNVFNQGRNSNGKPRAPKYMLDLEKVDPFLKDYIRF